MNRRGFFGKIGHGALALPVAAIASQQPKEPESKAAPIPTTFGEFVDCNGAMWETQSIARDNVNGLKVEIKPR